MSKDFDKLIYRLAEKYCPGWETVTSARNALMISFRSPDDLLKAIEGEMKDNSIINDRPKPAIPIEFVSNHVKDGIPRSYHNYQLCRTKCGQHFIGICRGGEWWVKGPLAGGPDLNLPENLEVEYWVDID